LLFTSLSEFRAQLQKGQSELSDSQKSEIDKQWGTQALDIEAEIKHTADRRKDMQLQIRWAQYYIGCLRSAAFYWFPKDS
jgi:hypothetical protein